MTSPSSSNSVEEDDEDFSYLLANPEDKKTVKRGEKQKNPPPATPFVGTYRGIENARINLYGCAFNQFIKWPELQIAAAVGGLFVYIYEFPRDVGRVEKTVALQLTTKNQKEELYQVVWCLEKRSYKLVCGGESGKLYVIDYGKLEVERELIGCGGAINDIRTCPTNSTIIGVATADNAARVFDIRSSTCLFILGGRTSHRDSVLSLDWTPDGMHIVTGGFDHSVMQWDLSPGKIQKHLKLCQDDLEETGRIRKFDFYHGDSRLHQARRIFDLEDHSMYILKPSHHLRELHYDSVDCVRVYTSTKNRTNYFFSKGTGHESAIFFWRFGCYGDLTEHVEPGKPYTCHMKFFEKGVPNGHPWFNKFDIDPRKQWLVSGAHGGLVHFYDMGDGSIQPIKTIKLGKTASMTRQVAFCDQGHFLFVVGDGGMIARLDRVKNGDPNPKDTWRR